MLIISVVQVGILWSDTGHGFPFSFLSGAPAGFATATNQYISEISATDAAALLLTPYRMTICDGGQRSNQTQKTHYPVSRKSALFTAINARCLVFYNDIMTVAPAQDLPKEFWGELVSGRGVLIEYRAAIRQDIVKWIIDRNNTAPGAPAEINKILIQPEDADGAQAVCLYILTNEKIVRTYPPSANYYNMQKLITDGLAELSAGNEDVAFSAKVLPPAPEGDAAGGAAGWAADGALTMADANFGGAPDINAANPGSGGAGDGSAGDVSAGDGGAGDGGDVGVGAQITENEAAFIDDPQLAEQPHAKGKAQNVPDPDEIIAPASGEAFLWAYDDSYREFPDPGRVPSPGADTGAAKKEPISIVSKSNINNIRYMTINEVGGGRFQYFSPDVFCIVDGPKSENFWRAGYTAPTMTKDRAELEEIILGSDIYSYNRSIDYSGTLVFKNISNIYRLYRDGLMEYNHIAPTQPADKGALPAALKNAAAFINNIESQLLDGAELVLSGIYENESDLSYRFTFDYIVGDYPVYFNDGQPQGGAADGFCSAITINANANRVLSCRWMLVDLYLHSEAKKLQTYFDRIDIGKNLTKMEVSDIAIAYQINLGAGEADNSGDAYGIDGGDNSGADGIDGGDNSDADGIDGGDNGANELLYDLNILCGWPVWAITSHDGAVETVAMSGG